MKRVINVLHMTDLHFRANESPGAKAQRGIVLNNFLDQLPSLLEPAPDPRDPNWNLTQQDWRPDLLAISGDLAFSGLSHEYRDVKDFLTRLRIRLNKADLPIIATPGNHDRNSTYAAGIAYPKSSNQADDWLSIERLQSDGHQTPEKFASRVSFSKALLTSPFREFQEFCRDMSHMLMPAGISGLEYITGYAKWPEEKPSLELLSVNSAWFCDYRTDTDARNLWLGLPMLEWLHYTYPRCPGAIRIALVHHPKEWLHEEECNSYGDRPNTYRFLADHCDVILSGHVHGSLEPPSAAYSGALVITGGASYVGGRWRNNFSLLQLNVDDRTIARRGFEYDPRERAWVESRVAQTINSLPRISDTGDSMVIPANQEIRPEELSGEWQTFFWIEGRADVSKWHNVVVIKAQSDGKISGNTKAQTTAGALDQRRYSICGELKNGFLTGSWESVAMPSDRVGAFQLKIVSQDEMRGRWVGFDRGHDINVGQWLFQRTTHSGL